MFDLVPQQPCFPDNPLANAGDYSMIIRNPNGSLTVRHYHPDKKCFLTVVISVNGRYTYYWSK